MRFSRTILSSCNIMNVEDGWSMGKLVGYGKGLGLWLGLRGVMLSV